MVIIKIRGLFAKVYIYDELVDTFFMPLSSLLRKGQWFKTILSDKGYEVEFNHSHMVQALKNINRSWEQNVGDCEFKFKCQIQYLKKNKPTK